MDRQEVPVSFSKYISSAATQSIHLMTVACASIFLPIIRYPLKETLEQEEVKEKLRPRE
jgi:hypothetical protein